MIEDRQCKHRMQIYLICVPFSIKLIEVQNWEVSKR